jgi:hypothetical protein
MWDPHQLEHSGAAVVAVVVDPGIHVVSPPIRIEDRPHVHRNDRIIRRNNNNNNNVVASAVERTIMSMVDSILLVLVMLGVYQL